jgi:hypothetical protein
VTVRTGYNKVGHTAAGSQSATEFAFLLPLTYRKPTAHATECDSLHAQKAEVTDM